LRFAIQDAFFSILLGSPDDVHHGQLSVYFWPSRIRPLSILAARTDPPRHPARDPVWGPRPQAWA
jgi:hypothetical protein